MRTILYNIISFVAVFTSLQLFAQGRLILNNDAYVVIDNSAYIVLDNPSPLALTTMGLGGNIYSEDEFDAIKWNIAATTGVYTVPFTTQTNNVKIPLTVNKTTAGTGAGYIIFSTYETATDMNTPWPSVVTNMYSNVVGGDGSLYVVDRFWRIDANSYTTKPNVNMTFAYDDNANEIAVTNTIIEPNLQAQRFNTISGGWDNLLFGVGNSIANTVSGVNITDPDFFQIWVLTDKLAPLPIELLSFDAGCVGGDILLSWATASETNNHYFTVEKSSDGITFEQIAQIEGANNSSDVREYSFTDKGSLDGLAYYRLSQTDYNGRSTVLGTKAVERCNDNSEQIHIYTFDHDQIMINILSQNQNQYTARLFDGLGRIVRSEQLQISSGSNQHIMDASGIASGIYFLQLNNPNKQFVNKLFLY